MNPTAKTGYAPLSDYFKKSLHSEIASPLTSVDLVDESEQDSFFFRRLEAKGIELNKQQIEAVRATSGPVLINAGAGSGKTTVIIARTGYLLQVEDVPANSVMLVTFTKKAADELSSRIRKLPGIKEEGAAQLTVGTFHSIFLRMLREAGVKRKILSSERYQHIILKQIMRKLHMADAYDPETVLSLILYYKNNLHTPDMLPRKTVVQKEIHAIYAAYENWKDNDGSMDFDDILLNCYQMLSFNQHVLKRYQQRFRYFIMDESQDTSPIQYEIMKMLAGASDSPHFCIVGDDSQCLYGFRSARPEFMMEFGIDFPESQTINLEVNYRSIDSIVGLGNAIIRTNKKRLEKTLEAVRSHDSQPFFSRPDSEEEEASEIMKTIKANQQKGLQLLDHTVLYRSNSNSRAIVDELVRQEIPFIIHGKQNNFYESSFIKPILDMLRLSLHPSNEEAIVGASTILYLRKDLVMKSLESLRQNPFLAKRYAEDKRKWVFDDLSGGMAEFQRNQLQNKEIAILTLSKQDPLTAIKTIRQGAIGYDKMLEMDEKVSLTLHKEMLLEMLDTLEQAARRFQTVADFVSFVDKVIETNRRMEELKKIPNYNAVHLMTVHASKGLEFKQVFLIGAVDDVMPHRSSFKAGEQNDRISSKDKKEMVQDALEEENRIFYVGVSRAEDGLYISSPRTYHGKEKEVSRFLVNAFREAK